MSAMANRSEHGFSRGGSFLTLRPGCSIKDEQTGKTLRSGDEIDINGPLYEQLRKANRLVYMDRAVLAELQPKKSKPKAKKEPETE